LQSDAPSTFRRDLISAYIASGAKVASWAIVAALIYRYRDATALAVFMLARSVFGLLQYLFLNIGPAMVRVAAVPATSIAKDSGDVPPATSAIHATPVLDYARPMRGELRSDLLAITYRTALWVVGFPAAIGAVLLVLYASSFERVHGRFALADDAFAFVLLMGFGFLARWISEPAGAVLQVRGRLALDNLFVAAADIAWVPVTLLAYHWGGYIRHGIGTVGWGFCLVSMGLLLARHIAVRLVFGGSLPGRNVADLAMARRLIAYGSGITLGQLADFLYAPFIILLLGWMNQEDWIAAYTPAIQIDAAMLLLVSGLAAVMLPNAALADARSNHERLRMLYVRGTLASAAVLGAAAAVVWACRGWLLELWFGDPMRTTQYILPFVLVHTVIGGSAAVGRSILIGMGKVRAQAAAALVGGVGNVTLALIFVYLLDLGLIGLILATVVAVTARCAIWQPWYVLRTLRRRGEIQLDASALLPPPVETR
jgi:O-antigen/teichoic acid export membrane protein